MRLATALGAAMLCLVLAAPASAVTIYAVRSGTSPELMRFDHATPGATTSIGNVSGLPGGVEVWGIDFRPANGKLYALGSNSRLYTLNTETAAATQVSAQPTDPLVAPTVPGAVGMDFDSG